MTQFSYICGFIESHLLRLVEQNGMYTLLPLRAISLLFKVYTLRGSWDCPNWGLGPRVLSVRPCEQSCASVRHGAVLRWDRINQVGCSHVHKTIQYVCTQAPLLHIVDKTDMSSENGKQNFVHLRRNSCV